MLDDSILAWWSLEGYINFVKNELEWGEKTELGGQNKPKQTTLSGCLFLLELIWGVQQPHNLANLTLILLLKSFDMQ